MTQKQKSKVSELPENVKRFTKFDEALEACKTFNLQSVVGWLIEYHPPTNKGTNAETNEFFTVKFNHIKPYTMGLQKEWKYVCHMR